MLLVRVKNCRRFEFPGELLPGTRFRRLHEDGDGMIVQIDKDGASKEIGNLSPITKEDRQLVGDDETINSSAAEWETVEEIISPFQSRAESLLSELNELATKDPAAVNRAMKSQEITQDKINGVMEAE